MVMVYLIFCASLILVGGVFLYIQSCPLQVMSQSYSIQFQAVVEAKCIFSLDFKLAVNWFSFHVNDTPKRRPYPLAGRNNYQL